ncbi:MAG TPA: VCBS repeat-containing protein [Terriglobia bacterium]|nr:VCBS repeat-containing protein [Terriglobia bacterium]
MRRVRQKIFCSRLSIEALFILSLVPAARALAPVSSQGYPDHVGVLSPQGFGREISIQADFDGDRQPDLLTGRLVEGAYRIEIQLSSDSRLDTSCSLVSDRQSGMVVFALDVDGDNDLDLVVTDGFSLFPKAVWLGDGKGHFENGDPLSWLGSFAVGQATTYRANPYGSIPAASGPNERLPFDKSPRASSHVISPAGEELEYRKSAPNCQRSIRQFTVRGPPFSYQFSLPS